MSHVSANNWVSLSPFLDSFIGSKVEYIYNVLCLYTATSLRNNQVACWENREEADSVMKVIWVLQMLYCVLGVCCPEIKVDVYNIHCLSPWLEYNKDFPSMITTEFNLTRNIFMIEWCSVLEHWMIFRGEKAGVLQWDFKSPLSQINSVILGRVAAF